jgi:hypothetical protein
VNQVSKFGITTVYLVSKNSKEEIAVVPCTEEDNYILKQNFSDKANFNAYLCQDPLTWIGVRKGDSITVSTNYDSKPYACISNNPQVTYE